VTSSLFVNVRAAGNGLDYAPAGYFYAVDGTAYPGAPDPPAVILGDGTDGQGNPGTWSGFSSGIAGGLMNVQDGLWASRMIGYPAQTIPMGSSYATGAANLATSIQYDAANWYAQHGNMNGFVITMSGYSQGAMSVMSYFRNYVLNVSGAHAHLLPCFYRIYLFGDPFRCPGIAHGNALAGLSEDIEQDGVETGGIGGNLDYTPDIANMKAPDGAWLVNSCANHGDIYTAAPTGMNPWTAIASAGRVGNLIFREIQNPTFVNTIEIAAALFTPIGMVEEIINGLIFFAAGTNAPHWLYYPQMDACIGDMVSLGNSLPHRRGY